MIAGLIQVWSIRPAAERHDYHATHYFLQKQQKTKKNGKPGPIVL